MQHATPMPVPETDQLPDTAGATAPRPTVTIDTVAGSHDVDALWASFVAARDAGDERLADALRDRMVEVQQERRLGRLSTDQLLERIDVLQRRLVARGAAREAGARCGEDGRTVLDLTDAAADQLDLDDLLRELERRAA